MKFYQSVTPAKMDEFIRYQGYDRQKALDKTFTENEYNNKLPRYQRNAPTETREYTLPDGKRWEDLDGDEQCQVLCNGYDIID